MNVRTESSQRNFDFPAWWAPNIDETAHGSLAPTLSDVYPGLGCDHFGTVFRHFLPATSFASQTHGTLAGTLHQPGGLAFLGHGLQTYRIT